jgi:hypothetical protein
MIDPLHPSVYHITVANIASNTVACGKGKKGKKK